jgi:hypothetical protein
VGSASTVTKKVVVSFVRFSCLLPVTTATNKPFKLNNANGVITFTTNHGSPYIKQIAFVDNDDIY